MTDTHQEITLHINLFCDRPPQDDYFCELKKMSCKSQAIHFVMFIGWTTNEALDDRLYFLTRFISKSRILFGNEKIREKRESVYWHILTLWSLLRLFARPKKARKKFSRLPNLWQCFSSHFKEKQRQQQQKKAPKNPIYYQGQWRIQTWFINLIRFNERGS